MSAVEPRTFHVPGDKSLTHRALILACLADGVSRIRGLLVGGDTRSTAAALRLLGCDIPDLCDGAEIRIPGRGLRGLRPPAVVLDCGKSGTTARLLMGVLAGHPFPATLTGDGSLRSRPMRRVTDPLRRMGAAFRERGEPDRLPIEVHGGSLTAIDYESPHASAQVKSAVLLAGLVAGVPVSVREPLPSRDHTERLLAGMGADLVRDAGDGGGARVALQPPDRLPALDFEIPGDFSSAAFLLAFACLAGRSIRVRDVGLNPGRTGFLRVLRRMGPEVTVENPHERCGEPVGDIVVSPAPLVATDVGGAEIPSLIDEVPVIAILAARAAGTTTISGAGELRVKESDRIAAVAGNLRRVGVEAEDLPEGMRIEGTGRALRGEVQTLHDHRIAMAFGLLAADPRNDVRIDEPAIVAVSFPRFWETLEAFR
jgi:3-phosphoshikimate 1-carboxyvinyltransferase